ncbi:MAG: hypothetical protein NTY47_02560, partial [Candidatus Omnitrophica bacterium]|nr:hypothetical protein [Candidatus Omnitrophota bacterium]
QKITYNFLTKTGVIYDAKFMSSPFFGKAERLDKVSADEFIARRTYVSTCSLDTPHYKLLTRKVNFFPGKKVNLTDVAMYVNKAPVLYMPEYNHNFDDPWMKLPISPGSKKEWGAYVLSAYRYNLNKNVKGLLLLDYRSKLGLAEGFVTNFNSENFGKGDFKFYYTDEKAIDLERLPTDPKNYTRYFARFRYKWDINERTNFVSEYYHITDIKEKIKGPGTADFLRDYFQREYERDSQPLTYALFHQAYDYSSLDLLMQVRNNHWFNQQSKMPELKYTMPNVQMGSTRFYFNSNSSSGVYNIKSDPKDITVSRFDTTNRFSHPLKVAIFDFNPYVGSQETIYDKGTNGRSHVVRTMFMSGADVSTKFFRVYNVKTNAFGLDINALRHIITPTFSYSYNHTPTVPSSNLKQIDAIDALTGSNFVSIGLQNKLQTKRKGTSVDLVDFLVTTSYDFKPKTGEHGSSFRDFYFQLKVLPFSWMRLESTSTYKHSGARDAVGYNSFNDVNYDLYFDLGKERSIGLGQRYLLKGSNEITFNVNWRLNPKWRFSMYQNRNVGHQPGLPRGVREQEYTISRDLHCWQMDLTFNRKKWDGNTFWLIFRMKAFPELEFGFDQSYKEPKSGSQVNP